jgi:fructose-bisphosphate aldolase, class I
VSIIEPELLMEGEFTFERSLAAHTEVLSAIFKEIHAHHVLLEGMLLKVSMVVLPKQRASPRQVAEMTCRALSRTVPPSLPGIVFPSGGQGDEEAIKNLQAINEIAKQHRSQYPWKLSFSYGKTSVTMVLRAGLALQGEAMKAWAKGDEKKPQELFMERAKWCCQASRGEYR